MHDVVVVVGYLSGVGTFRSWKVKSSRPVCTTSVPRGVFPDTHPHMLFRVRMYILCSACTGMPHAGWDAPRMWPSWLKTRTEHCACSIETVQRRHARAWARALPADVLPLPPLRHCQRLQVYWFGAIGIPLTIRPSTLRLFVGRIQLPVSADFGEASVIGSISCDIYIRGIETYT